MFTFNPRLISPTSSDRLSGTTDWDPFLIVRHRRTAARTARPVNCTLESLEDRSLLSAFSFGSTDSRNWSTVPLMQRLAPVVQFGVFETSSSVRSGAKARGAAMAETTARFEQGSYVPIFGLPKSVTNFVDELNAQIVGIIKSKGWRATWVPNLGRNAHITLDANLLNDRDGSHYYKSANLLNASIDRQEGTLSDILNRAADSALQFNGMTLRYDNRPGSDGLLNLKLVFGQGDKTRLNQIRSYGSTNWHITVGHFGGSGTTDEIANKVNHLKKFSADLSDKVSAMASSVGGPINLDTIRIVRTDNPRAQYTDYRIYPQDFAGVRMVRYRDARGSLVTVQLAGPGRLMVSNPTSDGQPRDVRITGSTYESKLTITAPSRGTVIGEIDVKGSLAEIEAPNIDLRGDLTVSGTIGAVTLNDVKAPSGHQKVVLGGGQTRLTFDNVQGLDINTAGVITSLSASSWLGDPEEDSSISAAAIGTIGIYGNLQDTTVVSTADVGQMKVGGVLEHVNVYAGVPEGVRPMPDSTLGFANQAIGDVSAKFTIDCVLAAKTLGTIDLGTLQSDADPFPSLLVSDTIGNLQVTDVNGNSYHGSNPDLATAGIVGLAKTSPVFNFSVVSDSHVGQENAGQRFQKVADTLAKNKKHASFVLFLGDAVNAGAERSQFQAWKAVVKASNGPPYDLVVGNHDGVYRTGDVSNYRQEIPNQVYGSSFVPHTLTTAGDLSYWFQKSEVLFVGLDLFATTNGANKQRYSQYEGNNVGHVSDSMVTALGQLQKPSSGITFMFGHVPSRYLLDSTNTTRSQARSLFSEFQRLGGVDYFAGHQHRFRGPTSVEGFAGLSQYIVGTGGNRDTTPGYITVTVNPGAGKTGVQVSDFQRA